MKDYYAILCVVPSAEDVVMRQQLEGFALHQPEKAVFSLCLTSTTRPARLNQTDLIQLY